jgi:hypothetical protein
MLPSSRFAVLCALILMGPSCSAVNPTASLDYTPSTLPTGPLWIATWLPAGMNDFRFGEQDRAYLADLGVNAVQWLQRYRDDRGTAEEQLMRFATDRGWQMLAYYEPSNYSPYDKLHNWATRGKGLDGDSLRAVVEGVYRQWNATPAFAGYLIGHEDYRREQYDSLSDVVVALAEIDAERPAYSVGRLRDYEDRHAFFDALFDSGGRDNVFQQEHYVFRGGVPSQGGSFQRRISLLADGFDEVARGLEGRSGRWHAIVQVQSEVRGTQVYYRKPTPAEIRLQVGLGLSRGASGIVYFLYSSGVEELRNGEGRVVETRVYEGLVDAGGAPTSSYAAVQQINGDLRTLSPTLELLHFHGTLSSRLLLQNSLIRRIDGEVEVGLFGDGKRISHILVVNRWAHAAQQVRLQLSESAAFDALTGVQYDQVKDRIELELAAGDFHLLRIEQRSSKDG